MPTPVANRVAVLILQHPQERREALSTAPLVCAALERATLRVGLSWSGLSGALGAPADPRHWAVLHLGPARPPTSGAPRRELAVLDREGAPIDSPDPILRSLQGIVLLDGTWSQAKTLWWRNPWLLRLHRIVLDPAAPARFGALRREPRREALSTLEAAALVLRRLEAGPEPADRLLTALDAMLAASPRREPPITSARPPPRRRTGRPRRR